MQTLRSPMGMSSLLFVCLGRQEINKTVFSPKKFIGKKFNEWKKKLKINRRNDAKLRNKKIFV